MAARNRRLVLAARPTGMVDETTVEMTEGPVPEPGPGEALARIRWLSIDPTIRTWMDDVPGYLPPIGIGEVIRSGAIAEVVATNRDDRAVGDLVFGLFGWEDYALISGDAGALVQPIPEGIEPALALNIFGTTGLTAYFGLLEIGGFREGDTVVVSGAAGATGSTVGQIARINGASKVVGIAGSDEKCRWITEDLGFDAAVNYRSESVPRRLREECPGGIDLYYDNVGGEILDAALGQPAMRGRVVLCGPISSYNDPAGARGPANYVNLIPQRGRMQGFIILDFVDRFPEAHAALAGWLLEGKLHHAEHVVEGLERAPEALNLLFTGGNTGKVVVKL